MERESTIPLLQKGKKQNKDVLNKVGGAEKGYIRKYELPNLKLVSKRTQYSGIKIPISRQGNLIVPSF